MAPRPDARGRSSVVPAPTTTWHGAPRPGPWASERLAWTAAVLAGALDVLLTLHGLGLGFAEANPVAAATVVAVGPVPGLAGLKLLALTVVAVGSRLVPPAVRPFPAALLAVAWAGASAYNAWLLLA